MIKIKYQLAGQQDLGNTLSAELGNSILTQCKNPQAAPIIQLKIVPRVHICQIKLSNPTLMLSRLASNAKITTMGIRRGCSSSKASQCPIIQSHIYWYQSNKYAFSFIFWYGLKKWFPGKKCKTSQTALTLFTSPHSISFLYFLKTLLLFRKITHSKECLSWKIPLMALKWLECNSPPSSFRDWVLWIHY